MKPARIIDIRSLPPQTWQEGLSRFLAEKKAEGSAERTLQGYKEIISLFFGRFPLAWGTTCRDCILLFLAQEGISPTTHNMRLKSLRPFFDFATREGAFSSSPAEGLRNRREAPRIVDTPMEDIMRLLDAIGTETFSTLRDTALLLLSLDSGIRPSEALRLRPFDVDTHIMRAVIRAQTAKTRQARTVYFSGETGSMIDRLLAARPTEWDDGVPVFCTSYGTPWNTHGWTTQLKRYAKKAKLKRFSAYDLRHCHAIQYLRNGGDVFTLQKGMGHSTLSMTERYLALSDEDVRRAHEKASPVSAMFPGPRKRVGKLPL